MSNSKSESPELKGLPEPEVRTKKQRVSIVWLVPSIASAIGGWLVYKAVSEKGPTVTITFKSGAKGWRPVKPRSSTKMSKWARLIPSC